VLPVHALDPVVVPGPQRCDEHGDVGVNPNISRLAGLVLESVKVVLVLAGQFANLCPRDGTSSNSIGQVQI
jgi:hypothetical protein